MAVGDFDLPVFGLLVVLFTPIYIIWRSNRLIMSVPDEDFRKCTNIDNYVFIGITCIICTL